MPPQTLIDAVKARTVVPFVGAGLSVGVRWGLFPNWRGLIERLAARLEQEALTGEAAAVRDHLGANRYAEAAELAFTNLGSDRFHSEMEASFDVPIPQDANLSAVEALWRLRPPAVITTNYDDVLRWPFVRRSNRFPSASRVLPRQIDNEDSDRLRRIITPVDDVPLVWHLHGSVARPHTIILTQRQYQRLYGTGSKERDRYEFALAQLRTVVANRTLLFIGFSLDDPFVCAQLDDIFELTSKQNPVSFLLLKKGEKDPAGMLAGHNVQIIEFDDFGPPLVKTISDIADEAWGPATGFVSTPGAFAALADDLVLRLRAIAPEPAIVGRAFNRWRPRGWPPVALGGDGIALALDAAGKLANAMRQSGGYYPLVEFVREVAVQSGAQGSRQLTSWIADAAAALGVDDDESARIVAGGFTTLEDDGNDEHYVLVRLEESGPEKWRGQAWLFSGTEPWKLFEDEREWERGDLPSLISELLDRLAALDLAAERTTVAFMVPRALMVEAIDQLEPALEDFREPPIGVKLPVTVRPLRQRASKRTLRQLGTTWQALKSAGAGSWTLEDAVPARAPGAAIWLRPADAGPGLIARLQQHQVKCVVLAAPPSSQAADAATDLFNCVLQAAIPAVIWLREPAATDATAARQKLEALLADSTVSLPQRVWQLRQAAIGATDPAHTGQCVVLLWDDADRLPPDHDPANQAVILRG